MAEVTSVEIDLITEFRKRFKNGELKNEQSSDMFLIRWIRARNQNLDKAEEMLRKSLQWRQENDIDNILSWEPPQEIKDFAPAKILGSDADNCPILLFKIGKMKFLKIVKSGLEDVFHKYCTQFYEKVMEEMKGKRQRNGIPVSKFTIIADYKGFQFKTLANAKVAEIMLKFGKNFEANQPETLKKFYAINSGKIFPVIFAMLKPTLAAETQAKTSVYNSSSKWKPALQQNIPLDVLPKAYGGNNPIFDSENAEADEDDTDDSDELLAMVIPQGGKAKLVFEVSEKNSSLNWAFKTDKCQIDFIINSISENKVYVKESQLDSNLKLVEGSVKCGAAGDYELIFSNSNASLEAQEMQYRIDIRSTSGAKQLLFD